MAAFNDLPDDVLRRYLLNVDMRPPWESRPRPDPNPKNPGPNHWTTVGDGATLYSAAFPEYIKFDGELLREDQEPNAYRPSKGGILNKGGAKDHVMNGTKNATNYVSTTRSPYVALHYSHNNRADDAARTVPIYASNGVGNIAASGCYGHYYGIDDWNNGGRTKNYAFFIKKSDEVVVEGGVPVEPCVLDVPVELQEKLGESDFLCTLAAFQGPRTLARQLGDCVSRIEPRPDALGMVLRSAVTFPNGERYRRTGTCPVEGSPFEDFIDYLNGPIAATTRALTGRAWTYHSYYCDVMAKAARRSNSNITVAPLREFERLADYLTNCGFCSTCASIESPDDDKMLDTSLSDSLL